MLRESDTPPSITQGNFHLWLLVTLSAMATSRQV
jgi:hypothetical protein